MGKSLLKVSRKKEKVRSPKFFDEKYLGPEPTWERQESFTEAEYKSAITRAYNWYNYFYSTKDSIKLLFDNYPRDKKEIRLLKRLPDWKLCGTWCYQARMMKIGLKLADDSLKFFNENIDALIEEAKKVVKEDNVEALKKQVVSVQDRVKEQISDYIGMIEEQVDQFMLNKYKSDFDMYAWLRSNNIKVQQSNAIAAYYKPQLAELVELQEGKCPDLNEGYRHMKKPEVKRSIEFFTNIISDAETWGANQKTVRKTRDKKPVSVEKQVSKLKYMSDYKDYKIVSIAPTSIIGANQLWVFNVKYRKLTLYNAMGPAGFSVKGTTLQGYDPENSESKTLRKPDDVLPRVLSGGKRVLSKVMGEINSKASEPNGRINGDTILLRVVK